MEKTKDGSPELELKRRLNKNATFIIQKEEDKLSCPVVYNDDLIMNNFKQINREICTFKILSSQTREVLETLLTLRH